MAESNETVLKDLEMEKFLKEIPDYPNFREEFYDENHEYTQEEINSYTDAELKELLSILNEEAGLYYYKDNDDTYDKYMEKIQHIKDLAGSDRIENSCYRR